MWKCFLDEKLVEFVRCGLMKVICYNFDKVVENGYLKDRNIFVGVL